MNIPELFLKFKKKIDKEHQFQLKAIAPIDNSVCDTQYSYIIVNEKEKICIITLDMYHVKCQGDTTIDLFDISDKNIKFYSWLNADQHVEFDGIPYIIRALAGTSKIQISFGTTTKTVLPSLKCQLVAMIQ